MAVGIRSERGIGRAIRDPNLSPAPLTLRQFRPPKAAAQLIGFLLQRQLAICWLGR
jgi:hypothetical protein